MIDIEAEMRKIDKRDSDVIDRGIDENRDLDKDI